MFIHHDRYAHLASIVSSAKCTRRSLSPPYFNQNTIITIILFVFYFRAHYESQYMWIVKGTLIFFSLLINQRTIFHLRPRFLHSHFSNYIKAHRNPCFSSSTTFISLIFTVQSNPMFLRIFIGCCLLAIVCCVPVNKTTSTAATNPASTPILPDIDIPDAIAEKSSFERLGKCMN